MTDLLSIEERQSALVTEALNRDWIQVMDERGRKVYYNPTTKETTRDLRMFLLRQQGWKQLESSAAAREAKQAKDHRDVNVTTMEEQLRQELHDAKALVEAYEAEVTWLRMALLEAEGKLDRGELAVAETSRLSRFSNRTMSSTSATTNYNNNSNNLTSSEQQRSATPKRSASPNAARGSLDEDDPTVLRRKLGEARRLNQRLLERVSLDRQTKHLCTRCMHDVDLKAAATGADDTLSALQRSRDPATGSVRTPYSLTVPGGVGFPSTLSNPISFDSIMLSRGLAAASVSHPAATVSQLGYLPKRYDPMRATVLEGSGSNNMGGHATSGRMWESPAKQALSPNRVRNPAALTGGNNNNNNSPLRASRAVGARAGPNNSSTSYGSYGSGGGGAGMPGMSGDVHSTAVLERNLHGLQMLRSSLEGDFPRDAHVRDADRNDFFRSPYFTASLKNKTAGSKSTTLIEGKNNNNNNNNSAFLDSNGNIVVPPPPQQYSGRAAASNNAQQPLIAAAQESSSKRKLSSAIPGRLYSGQLYGSAYYM